MTKLNEIRQRVAESALPNTALQECASDLLALCEEYDRELREAVKQLQVWIVYESKDSLPPGVDIDKSVAIVERYHARRKEVQDGN